MASKSSQGSVSGSVFTPGRDTYSVFLENPSSERPGVLVVRGGDKAAVRAATEKLGKPVASAKLSGGILKLDAVKAGRCFGSAVAAGGPGGLGGPGPVERGGGVR